MTRKQRFGSAKVRTVIGTLMVAAIALSATARAENRTESKSLFPPNLATRNWVEFSAEGFSAPVVGVIHDRSYPAKCGMPLGGIGTGCLDLETSGRFGLCSIFNSHMPRRGALNVPFLGLTVGGQTWVLTTGQQSPEKGSG